jgi:DNA-binding PadR family transcriptional regulator
VSRDAAVLSLTEWSVLGFVAEGETYGFSVARLFTPDGTAGKIWTVPRPLVYRAIDTLSTNGYVTEAGSQPGSGGPRRTLVRATSAGVDALDHWLDEPIAHIRDARSHLLMKLLLIDRRGGSPRALVTRQREELVGIIVGLERQIADADGFDVVILRWRLYSVETLDRFLAEVGSV